MRSSATTMKLVELRRVESDDNDAGGILTPTERHRSRPIGSFLDERLVELATRWRVDVCPAMLAVVLQAHDVCAEEWRKLAATVNALTFITDLVVQYIRLHFDLQHTKALKLAQLYYDMWTMINHFNSLQTDTNTKTCTYACVCACMTMSSQQLSISNVVTLWLPSAGVPDINYL